MKILSAAQTRALDNYTIANEPIESIDLMERASNVFVDWFVQKFRDEETPIQIFVGIGNNGGDGLAVARILHQKFYNVQIFWCQISKKVSKDFQVNLERLPPRAVIPVQVIQKGNPFPKIDPKAIVIDAIFGSGINRPVTGYWATLFDYINQESSTIVSIDIPSGLFPDQATAGTSIQADYTLSFEMPKLAFLFPENYSRLKNWSIHTIQLHQDGINQAECINFYMTLPLLQPLLRKRKKYGHKGTYGHALLIMGSYGKVGAAVLAAKACLRSGAGLVSVHAPKCAYEILQISVPEAMISLDEHPHYFSALPALDSYHTIGIGCGLDQQNQSAEAVQMLLQSFKKPIVLDADALNILSKNPDWHTKIPKGSILTPHPKEFERLFGKSVNDFERNKRQREQAKKLGVYLILKGAHTCIATPEGHCYFNSTGNPGMATGGSGDVLTGIITGLLAQSYSSFEASLLGVWLHGMAGDLGAQKLGQESLLAGDLIDYLGQAFFQLK